jgi:hypothetical protein
MPDLSRRFVDFVRFGRRALVVAVLAGAGCVPAAAQRAESSTTASTLPDPPLPKLRVHEKSKVGPCQVVPAERQAGSAMAAGAADQAIVHAGLEAIPHGRQSSELALVAELPPCPPQPIIDWFARFMNGPEVKPLTPAEKGRLAVRNLLDPFNAVTIVGQSAITIAADSHTAYGPGFPGFAKNVGVSYSQDMTGEFLGTFLLPSIFRQDPHYHRMPHASIPRRFGHAIVEVVWGQGDNGRGMINFSNLIGYAAADEISNLYVPGRQTDLPATAARYGIGLGTAPIDNFITEFLPDLARRIHVRVVLVQRIIDQVARNEGGTNSQ